MHDATTQKAAIFILATVKISNRAICKLFIKEEILSKLYNPLVKYGP
jgi:hypothetical protein